MACGCGSNWNCGGCGNTNGCACAVPSDVGAYTYTSNAIEQIPYTSRCPGGCLVVTATGYRCSNSCGCGGSNWGCIGGNSCDGYSGCGCKRPRY
ncbi:MAG: hypothetical protein LBD02_09955 [Christensenellaceae bacterium]|jgi:hypothetical protein|nr:hypothetical protein [Christensenellaceae bacterium]